MGKVILITFAGREDRMELLKIYASKLLDKRLLNQWHIQDFTRNEKDREIAEGIFSKKHQVY